VNLQTGSRSKFLEGDNSERRDSNLRQVIDGQVPRTNFLIGRLADYLRFDAELDIFIQAAFSSFSISNDPIYSESNDPEYVRLLQIERDHLEELLKKNAVKLKLMVWPFRDFASDPRYLPKGLRTLLNWMKENTLNPKVRFVCGPIRGPNRMVFSSRPTDASGFFIDGYKHEFTAGHHLSIVNYQRSAIEAAVREFSDLFAELALRQRDNQQAVQTLLEETRRKFPGLATKSEFAAGV